MSNMGICKKQDPKRDLKYQGSYEKDTHKKNAPNLWKQPCGAFSVRGLFKARKMPVSKDLPKQLSLEPPTGPKKMSLIYFGPQSRPSICLYIGTYTCIYIYIYVCMYVCVYTYMYVCIHRYANEHIHIYTYT